MSYNYGTNSYAGGIDTLLSLLGPALGSKIAGSDFVQGLTGGDETANNLVGGASSLLLGGLGGYLGGKQNVLPGALSAVSPYIMKQVYSGMGSDEAKKIGAGGQTPGGSKTQKAGGYFDTNPNDMGQPGTGGSGQGSYDAEGNYIPAAAPQGAVGTATGGDSGGGDGGTAALYKLLMRQYDPNYMAMMQGPQMAGAFAGMGENAASSQYARKMAEYEQAIRDRKQQNSNRAIFNMYNKPGYQGGAGPMLANFATGGYINDTPVESLAPMARVRGGQPYQGASPTPRDVMPLDTMTMAEGGPLRGEGDGMSDHIPAKIDGKHPAKVATGEFIVPVAKADHYGDKLQKMMKAVRHAAYPVRGEQIKQDAAKKAFIHSLTGVKA